MIQDTGIIVSIDKEKGLGVMVDGVDKCESCSIKTNCAQKRGEVLYIPYKDGYAIGQKVKIEIGSISLYTTSIVLYGIPLVVFLCGIFAGYYIFFKNMEEFIKSILSFALSLLLLIPVGFAIRAFDKKKQKQVTYHIEKIDWNFEE